VKELALALAGPATGIAPGTELGSQLLTRGRLPASGGRVAGGSVITGLTDGVAVGVTVGVAVAVGAGKLCVVGTGEGEWLVATGPAQPAAISRTTIPTRAALATRPSRCDRIIGGASQGHCVGGRPPRIVGGGDESPPIRFRVVDANLPLEGLDKPSYHVVDGATRDLCER
jgi:hypothetical protein